MKKMMQGFMTAASLVFSAVGAQALEVGQQAPLFTAASTQGEIALGEILQRQPVILAFYYADFTPV